MGSRRPPRRKGKSTPDLDIHDRAPPHSRPGELGSPGRAIVEDNLNRTIWMVAYREEANELRATAANRLQNTVNVEATEGVDSVGGVDRATAPAVADAMD